jgi:hypothetical protein
VALAPLPRISCIAVPYFLSWLNGSCDGSAPLVFVRWRWYPGLLHLGNTSGNQGAAGLLRADRAWLAAVCVRKVGSAVPAAWCTLGSCVVQQAGGRRRCPRRFLPRWPAVVHAPHHMLPRVCGRLLPAHAAVDSLLLLQPMRWASPRAHSALSPPCCATTRITCAACHGCVRFGVCAAPDLCFPAVYVAACTLPAIMCVRCCQQPSMCACCGSSGVRGEQSWPCCWYTRQARGWCNACM